MLCSGFLDVVSVCEQYGVGAYWTVVSPVQISAGWVFPGSSDEPLVRDISLLAYLKSFLPPIAQRLPQTSEKSLLAPWLYHAREITARNLSVHAVTSAEVCVLKPVGLHRVRVKIFKHYTGEATQEMCEPSGKPSQSTWITYEHHWLINVALWCQTRETRV